MLNSIWSYKGHWVLGIIARFRVGFRGGVNRDLETNQNKLHHYKNKIQSE